MIGESTTPMAKRPGEETAALAANAAALQQRMADAAARSGRAPEDITLVAVSKTVPPARLRAAFALGFHIFGENRVQEAQEKQSALDDLAIRWELIGHLQTNKAVRAVRLFARVQSVDSVRVAEALDARAAEAGRILPVLLEVNVAEEPNKTGALPADVPQVATALARCDHLRPEGLMTVAPLVARAEEARPVFRRLRLLADRLRETAPCGADGGWRQLSMGMSDDFEVAIEEGATIVRLGRALFGARPLA